MKRIALRLDLDTTAGARGLRDLLQISTRFEFTFSIFVNMGRSISLRAAMARRLLGRGKKLKNPGSAKKVSVSSKLGLRGLGETIFFNPRLFPLCREELIEMRKSGVEVGLHGGMNHGIWQTWADELSQSQVDRLLIPALDEFRQYFGEGFGFASPGYRANDYSYQLLKKNDCRYVSDSIETTFQIESNYRNSGLPNLPVTLAAANTVDFLENYIAAQRTEPLESILLNKFSACDTVVYYSHPCFILGPGKAIFTRLVEIAKQHAEICTVGELLDGA